MRRILYRLSLIAALLPVAAKAQTQPDAVSMSMEDAVQYALKNKDSMKNARIDELIALAKNAEVTGMALPQVSGTGSFQYYPDPQKSFIPAEFQGGPAGTFVPVQFLPNFNTNASATISQILFDGSVVVALQARKALEDFARINVKRSEEEVRASVMKSYYGVQVTRKQLEILTDTYQDLKKVADENEVMYQTGLVERIAVDQLRVQANNTLTEKIKLENMYLVSQLALKFQIGMPIAQVLDLTDTLYPGMVTMADLLEEQPFDYSMRLDYNLIEKQMDLNKMDLKRYKWQNLPSLSASATGGYLYAANEFNQVFKGPYQWYSLIGVNLNVPIFDGNQRRNRVKQAAYKVEQNVNTLHNVKEGIDLQQAQSRITLRNAILALENQRENAELAERVFNLAQIKYKEGVGSNVEVVQAEAQLLQAQGNFFNALNAALAARVDLQKSLGLLNK